MLLMTHAPFHRSVTVLDGDVDLLLESDTGRLKFRFLNVGGHWRI